MALLTTQQITRAGLTPSLAAVGGSGDEFHPDDNVFLRVDNGSGGSINVTVVTPKTVRGQAIADLVVAVPAAGSKLIGPLPKEDYANPADGKGDISYSATTSLTIAVLELTKG